MHLFKHKKINNNIEHDQYKPNMAGDRVKKNRLDNNINNRYVLNDITAKPSISINPNPRLIQDIVSTKTTTTRYLNPNTSHKASTTTQKLSSDFKELFASDEASINQVRKSVTTTHPIAILAYILLGLIPSIAIIITTLYGGTKENIIIIAVLLVLNYIIYLLLPKNYMPIWIASIINSLIISSYLIWWLNTHLVHYQFAQWLSIIVLALLNIFLYLRNQNMGLIMSSIFISILLSSMTALGIINLDFIYPLLTLHIIVVSLLNNITKSAPIFLNIHRIVLGVLLTVLMIVSRPSLMSASISVALLLIYFIYLYFTTNEILLKTIYLLIGNVLLLLLTFILSYGLELKYLFVISIGLILMSLSWYYIKYLEPNESSDFSFLRKLIFILIACINFAPFIFGTDPYLVLTLLTLIILVHTILYSIYKNPMDWINLLLGLILSPVLVSMSLFSYLGPATNLVIYYSLFSLILLAVTLYFNTRNFKELEAVNILFLNISILLGLIIGYYSGPMAMVIGAACMALVLAAISIKFSWPNLMPIIIIAINLALTALGIQLNWVKPQIWAILVVNVILYVGSLILPKRFSIPIGMAVTLFAPLMILLNIQTRQGIPYHIIFWGLAILMLLTLLINKLSLYYNLVLITIYTGIGTYFYHPSSLVSLIIAMTLVILTLIFRKNRTDTIFDLRRRVG